METRERENKQKEGNESRVDGVTVAGKCVFETNEGDDRHAEGCVGTELKRYCLVHVMLNVH